MVPPSDQVGQREDQVDQQEVRVVRPLAQAGQPSDQEDQRMDQEDQEGLALGVQQTAQAAEVGPKSRDWELQDLESRKVSAKIK